MGYASEDAEAALGFVREIPPSELEEHIRQNQQKKSRKGPASIFTRSPFELDLVNERILELRRPSTDTNHRLLRDFRGPELTEAIESGNLVFAMFWTNVNSVSTHAFELWSKASELLKNLDGAVVGAVPCHEEPDVCKAFGISHQDHRTVYAYKDAKKYATQVGMRDEHFYVEWAKMQVLYVQVHLPPKQAK